MQRLTRKSGNTAWCTASQPCLELLVTRVSRLSASDAVAVLLQLSGTDINLIRVEISGPGIGCVGFKNQRFGMEGLLLVRLIAVWCFCHRKPELG